MRELADRDRISRFMVALGSEARTRARVYFTGGATAVLEGWRSSTIDVDVVIVPETEVLRTLPELKEHLHLNVELASPAHFIPVLPGWEERSPFVAQHGLLSFHHFELVAQALAKIERGHSQDQADVAQMLARGLVSAAQLRDYFDKIEPQLYRHPAIDPPSFRAALEAAAPIDDGQAGLR
ncbi:MAG: DUF6036 family nucleotidyltransferase [Acidimicrobiales bacterium]